MRKKLRHLSSEAGTKKATYDIALLKDGSRPKELNDLSGSLLEDQITIASGISETEASHLKKNTPQKFNKLQGKQASEKERRP